MVGTTTQLSAGLREEFVGYVITGFVVEVTSIEVASAGAAAKTPVRVVLENWEGRWLITEYAKQQ
jgi:hypothetical protein